MKRQEFAQEKEKVKKNAYITLIIDESGSMGSVKDATVSGINEQIQQLKKDFGGDKRDEFNTFVSLIRFNATPTSVFMYSDIDSLQEIAPKDYNPSGNTAMYDAVGYAINQLKSRPDIEGEDTSSLIIVVSDGEENASKEFNPKSIADMVGELNKTKRWTFTYLGANQDLSKVSEHTNISYGNTASFNSRTKGGVMRAFSMNASALHDYSMELSRGVYASANFYAGSELKEEDADGFGNPKGAKTLV